MPPFISPEALAKSFADIESERKIPPGILALPPNWQDLPVLVWYKNVRDRPLSQFDIGDVVLAVQQEYYPEYTVPLALKWLQQNPLVGDCFDGELLLQMKYVSSEYWRTHPAHKSYVEYRVRLVLSAQSPPNGDSFEDLLRRLKRIKTC